MSYVWQFLGCTDSCWLSFCYGAGSAVVCVYVPQESKYSFSTWIYCQRWVTPFRTKINLTILQNKVTQTGSEVAFSKGQRIRSYCSSIGDKSCWDEYGSFSLVFSLLTESVPLFRPLLAEKWLAFYRQLYGIYSVPLTLAKFCCPSAQKKSFPMSSKNRNFDLPMWIVSDAEIDLLFANKNRWIISQESLDYMADEFLVGTELTRSSIQYVFVKPN